MGVTCNYRASGFNSARAVVASGSRLLGAARGSASPGRNEFQRLCAVHVYFFAAPYEKRQVRRWGASFDVAWRVVEGSKEKPPAKHSIAKHVFTRANLDPEPWRRPPLAGRVTWQARCCHHGGSWRRDQVPGCGAWCPQTWPLPTWHAPMICATS